MWGRKTPCWTSVKLNCSIQFLWLRCISTWIEILYIWCLLGNRQLSTQLDFPRSLIADSVCRWKEYQMQPQWVFWPVSNGQSWTWEDTGGSWVEERCSRWRRMFSSRRVGYLARTFWRKLGRKKEGIISLKEEFLIKKPLSKPEKCTQIFFQPKITI